MRRSDHKQEQRADHDIRRRRQGVALVGPNGNRPLRAGSQLLAAIRRLMAALTRLTRSRGAKGLTM